MEEIKNKNNYLKNIKSKYILKNIIDNVSQKKLLYLIKYNKCIQKILDIGIKDFEKYYLNIEIDIIPIYKKEKNSFINIKNEYKSYYHIYFNEKENEIKRTYFTIDDNISKIKIIIDEEMTSLKDLFLNINCIEKANFIKFNRINIVNMSGIFKRCSELKELNINNIKTNNVTDMSGMFSGCSLLKDLNLKNFNTNNVKNMSWMFSGCTSLKELNLKNFNTNNVNNMSNMFYHCSSLKELNLNNFKTNKVTDMSRMFAECKSLNELRIGNFNTNNVKDMSYMFNGCSSLKELNLDNFNTNNVKDMSRMFSGCTSLNELKFKNFRDDILILEIFSKMSPEFTRKIKSQFKGIDKYDKYAFYY